MGSQGKMQPPSMSMSFMLKKPLPSLQGQLLFIPLYSLECYKPFPRTTLSLKGMRALKLRLALPLDL